MDTRHAIAILAVAASAALSAATLGAQAAVIAPTQIIAPPPDPAPWPYGEAYIGRMDNHRNTLLVVPSAGRAAYVYTRQDASSPWIYSAELALPDGAVFINDVALHGDTAAVSVILRTETGDVGLAFVHIFKRGAHGWRYRQTLAEPASAPPRPEYFGYRFDLSGDTLAVPNFVTGVVYVYERNGQGDFEYRQELRDDAAGSLGFDVAIDGKTMLVSALGSAAHIFTRTASGWVRSGTLLPPPTTDANGFAEEVALDGRTAVVSAPWADQRSEPYFTTGKAFVYRRIDKEWILEAQLSDPIENEGLFGYVVEVQGDQIVVNAWGRLRETNALTERLLVFERHHGSWLPAASISRDGQVGFGYVVSWSGKDLITSTASAQTENPVFEGELLHYVIPRRATSVVLR
jgi:hypothetical protein